MTPERASKDGVVLTGGGAKGAWEVGVLQALFEGRSPATNYQPLDPEIFTGTSIGAYNAGFLVAQEGPPAAAVARLGDVWRRQIADSAERCGNGVFRLRDGPLNGLDPACWTRPLGVVADTVADAAFWTRYLAVRGTDFLASSRQSLEGRVLDTVNLASAVDVTPMYRLLDDTVDPAGLRASPKTLTIAATNWRTGQVRLFYKADLAGPAVGLLGIAASAAIPLIFPPVVIDGVPFHDGGVLHNTPLLPAIRACADVIHVLFLDPRVVDIPLSVPPNSVDTYYRQFLITSAALLRRDLELAFSINEELELHRDLGILTPDLTTVIGEPWRGKPNSRVLRRQLQERPYRSLTVHVYRPETDLGGGAGLLDFSERFVSELIEMGYQHAVRHDCEASGCLLPTPAR